MGTSLTAPRSCGQTLQAICIDCAALNVSHGWEEMLSGPKHLHDPFRAPAAVYTDPGTTTLPSARGLASAIAGAVEPLDWGGI